MSSCPGTSSGPHSGPCVGQRSHPAQAELVLSGCGAIKITAGTQLRVLSHEMNSVSLKQMRLK